MRPCSGVRAFLCRLHFAFYYKPLYHFDLRMVVSGPPLTPPDQPKVERPHLYNSHVVRAILDKATGTLPTSDNGRSFSSETDASNFRVGIYENPLLICERAWL